MNLARPYAEPMNRGEPLVKLGMAGVLVAVLGWVVTLTVVPFTQKPLVTEDLTAAWTHAGPTPLGEQTTVPVPPGHTLVAFLVGTDLYGIAGTTTGTCAASLGGRPIDLSGRVQIDRSLTGVLRDGQQTAAIAGWRNTGKTTSDVAIRCRSGDSTVEHYVALDSRTAVLTRDPWFQPWGWAGVGALGAALIGAGLLRNSSR